MFKLSKNHARAALGPGRPHVVIVGGGFGGLHAANALAKAPVRVTVVDKHNYHLFQPLLYQVATAALSPANIAAPIRHILARHENTEVLLAEAVGVDAQRRILKLADGEMAYDYLILATGATHSYFGHPEWAKVAPGLKTIEDAVEIRGRFLVAFEAAERESDPEGRRAKLTFVVVGGGPTGVELAGSMIEIARRAIPRDFRHIDTKTARVILVEANERLLMGYPPELSARAKRDLEDLGVEVRLGGRVTEIDENGVMIGTERIEAENVIWAAGVSASPLGKSLGVPMDHSGRVLVRPDLSIPGHPELFVVGDLASIMDKKTGQPVPGVAQGAMQMGKFVAGVIRREVSQQPAPPRPAFQYHDRGILATIGRARAVGVVAGMKLKGFLAWLIWAGVHITELIGFRNRIMVMVEWGWLYLVFERGARLITGVRAMDIRRSRQGAEEIHHRDTETQRGGKGGDGRTEEKRDGAVGRA
jgi:NADH dehydrogenase